MILLNERRQMHGLMRNRGCPGQSNRCQTFLVASLVNSDFRRSHRSLADGITRYVCVLERACAQPLPFFKKRGYPAGDVSAWRQNSCERHNVVGNKW